MRFLNCVVFYLLSIMCLTVRNVANQTLKLTANGVAHLMTMMEKTFAETPKRTMAARTYPSPTRWNSSTVE